MADFHRQAFDGTGDNAHDGKEHGVAVAGDDLGRNRLGLEAHGFGHVRLDLGVDVGEGADGARYGAGRDFLARCRQTFPVAGKLGVGLGHLEAEGYGLGVDAVAAPDANGHLVFQGAPLEDLKEGIQIGEKDVCGLGQLYV